MRNQFSRTLAAFMMSAAVMWTFVRPIPSKNPLYTIVSTIPVTAMKR